MISLFDHDLAPCVFTKKNADEVSAREHAGIESIAVPGSCNAGRWPHSRGVGPFRSSARSPGVRSRPRRPRRRAPWGSLLASPKRSAHGEPAGPC